jgi:hypothetical protein
VNKTGDLPGLIDGETLKIIEKALRRGHDVVIRKVGGGGVVVMSDVRKILFRGGVEKSSRG